MSSSRNPQIYVGGLSRRTRTEDLDRAFGKFGKIRDISIKGKYAFVVSIYIFYQTNTITDKKLKFEIIQEYDDYHDARDACDKMDGYKLDGEKLQVEPTSKYISILMKET